MRGLTVTEYGAPPRLAADLPSVVRERGTTVVRMAAVTVAHLDLTVASGTFKYRPPLPYVPCGDGAGWVAESGAFAAGTLVWLRGGGVGVSRDGLAREYAVVPDEAVHPAPPGTDPALAACFFSPATSAWLAVHELGGVKPADQVLVAGGGGAVGSLAVQLALAAGAEVSATVSRPHRAALVPAGATPVVASQNLPQSRFDVLIETVGGTELAERLAAVKPGGTAVIVGYTAGTRATLDLPARCAHDVDLRFLNMIRRAPQAFALADGLLARLSAAELALRMDRYPLERAEEAWTALAAGRAGGRVVLEVNR